jgi:phosphatidylserine synthase
VPQPTEPKESPMPIPTPQPATTTATTTEITPGSATTTEEGTQNPGIVTAASSMNNLCIVGSAAKLWVLLLILYAIFAVTLMAQRLDETSPRTREWNIALILAVFIGLLLFWYVSAQCRTGPWAPAIATLIAVVGLVATMLKPQIHQQILLLKEPRK